MKTPIIITIDQGVAEYAGGLRRGQRLEIHDYDVGETCCYGKDPKHCLNGGIDESENHYHVFAWERRG